MHVVGDGPEGQPTDGELSLESLADGLDGDEALDESEEDEGSDESEVDESEGEEEPEDDDESEEGEEATLTVKHDGKDVTLKQSEVIELAQKGFDYTQKTMALAEERKAIEPIRQAAEQARTRADENLQQAVAYLDGFGKFLQSQIGDPPPISLAQTNAADYLARKEVHEARKGQLHQVLAEAQRLQDEAHRQRQARKSEKIVATEKALKDTLPGWNDAKFDELLAYTRTAGIEPNNDMAMLEPGFWQIAEKARAFDALQAEKAKVKPATKVPPRVNKPGGTPPPPQLAKRQDAFKAHKAKPSLGTLADLL